MKRLLAMLALSACSEDPGTGRVVGSLSIPACEAGEPLEVTCEPDIPLETCEAFDLQADFFALEPYGDGVLMRFQKGGRILALTDALVLTIGDHRLLRGNLGRTLPVGPDQNIRGALGLFHLCPDSTQSYAIHGFIRFEAFGVDKNDHVRGVLERLEVRDGRALGGVGRLLGVLHGDFDFQVHKGRPYQPFAE